MTEFRRFALLHGMAVCSMAIGLPASSEQPIQTQKQSAHQEAGGADVKSFLNLTYNEGAGQGGICDLLVPIFPDDETTSIDHDQQSDGPPICVAGIRRAVVVMVHGGGWVSGDKFMMGEFAELMAKQGICVVNINYRHAPEHPFPAQLDDIRDSLLYVTKNANALSIDLNRLGLFGYSAGGHLSLLLAVLQDEPMTTKRRTSDWAIDDPRWKRLPKIASVCAGGPPCDFTQLPPNNRTFAFFLRGSPSEFPDLYHDASPLIHVTASDPPTTLIHGETDLIVPVSNSLRMTTALRAAKVPVTTSVVPRSGHLMTFISSQMKQSVAEFAEKLRRELPQGGDNLHLP